jgi:hypothetical protein
MFDSVERAVQVSALPSSRGVAPAYSMESHSRILAAGVLLVALHVA